MARGNSGPHLLFFRLGVVRANAKLQISIVSAYKGVGEARQVGAPNLGLEVMYSSGLLLLFFGL